MDGDVRGYGRGCEDRLERDSVRFGPSPTSHFGRGGTSFSSLDFFFFFFFAFLFFLAKSSRASEFKLSMAEHGRAGLSCAVVVRVSRLCVDVDVSSSPLSLRCFHRTRSAVSHARRAGFPSPWCGSE